MIKFEHISLFFLRVGIGWYFLWAGATKILAPNWSAAGYLKGAKSFAGFYHFFASESMLPMTNFLNEWGITLIGLALIVGICVRFASFAGILLMALYYFALDFPFPDEHSFIVDDHIIFIIGLFVLAATRAGQYGGLFMLLLKHGCPEKCPRLSHWLS